MALKNKKFINGSLLENVSLSLSFSLFLFLSLSLFLFLSFSLSFSVPLSNCGNNGQGRSLITFIWSWQFKSQINTNSTQRGTPAFIQNKWADPLGRGRADLLGRGRADPIQVKTRISNNFMWRQKIGGKVPWNKEKRGINEHDKIIQYFPQNTDCSSVRDRIF
jgi:hypothetical protein